MDDPGTARFASAGEREEHFRLFFFVAVAELVAHLDATLGSRHAVEKQFPFLAAYAAELASSGLAAGADGLVRIEAWEAARGPGLPLVELRRAAGLLMEDLVVLAMIGLAEEDGRFGYVFEALHGIAGQHRPTAGLLLDWGTRSGRAGVRRSMRRLSDIGLVAVANPEAARAQWALQVPAPLWDALRGEVAERPLAWGRYRAPDALTPLDRLVIPASLRESLARLQGLLARGEVRTVVLRGPRHNGRRTIAGALARSLGAGVLEIDALGKPEERRLQTAALWCVLAGALPVVTVDLGPGESVAIEEGAQSGPLFAVLGKQGSLTGAAAERAVTFAVDLPGADERRAHWRAVLGDDDAHLDELSGAFRMSSGNLRTAAAVARSYARLAQRLSVTVADVRLAARSLHRQALETLATRLEAEGDWGRLSVAPETRRELDQLTARCRAREDIGRRLGAAYVASINPGLRALFQGPSGTGKTLAAKLLAATLGKDLYRLEIASVVNKYIGETEKNLGRVFELAEELDVVLLLDEGDALLARRTGVHTSNDRYANLETNFLLQRLESFEGIVVVTTNAAEHIDSAFQRRMDVVVDFRAPDVAERMRLWQLHLPAEHDVGSALLRELAGRCALTGGQIRNAVLHAAVMAFAESAPLNDDRLVAAVQREYRKSGAVCPLRSR